MALGGLISSKQISCKGDVKADIHVRRVLGRIFYQNYEKEILSEEEATELTRKIYPENPWTLDGPLYLIGGNNCKAKEPDCDNCYTTSLCDYFMSEKKGTTSAFWYKKGWALYLQGEYEEAIKCYDKALKIEPKNFITLNNKGLTLYVQGEYEEAIKCYDKALKIEPASSFVLYNKGMALYGQGEYEEAIKCYNKALKIEPDSSLVLYNKGLALYGQVEYEEAIKCYDKALKIEPDNINILNRLKRY
jgi:tetratricopeptide (TPR) repeat protein